jgi:urate oxidase
MATRRTVGVDSVIALAENRYGKCRVRMVQVKRHPNHHDFREWTVEILLEGDFESCFVDGDNSKILATDTMKNTVYSLARDSAAGCMEEFGQELAAYLLKRNPQVSAARITLSERTWGHLEVAGRGHPTTFVQGSSECQTADIQTTPHGNLSIGAGFENLVIMKTAGSEFAGFIKDPLTTLADTKDRLLGTSMRAQWKYSSTEMPFPALRSKIRETLLKTFADHTSKSVQHTLYAMGKAALESVREIEEIELTLPNKHCLLVDLSRFGQNNPNEIFMPIDEPHGYIEARLRRRD